MDWITWLSKTGLEPSVVYEYGQAFAQNELEEEDIAYFNHEFLQSMGITIAKHRLEILKLARTEKGSIGFMSLKHPMAKILLALKKTKKSLANYIATLVHGNDGRALIVVPNKKNKKKNKSNNKNGGISYSTRWKKAMMLRSNSRKLVMFNSSFQDRLLLTNGDYLGEDGDGYVYDDHHHDHHDGSVVVSTPKLDSYSSPLMYDLQQSKNDEKILDEDVDDDDDHEDGGYWSPALEEIRWDAMFQDLKPT